jgi:hypothetical protein
MAKLGKLETSLDEALNKKAPFKLPENVRKWVAVNLWWISLVTGLLQLWAAWSLWDLGHKVDRVIDLYNEYLGDYYSVDDLGMFYYIALIGMAVVGALLLLATPALKAMKKSGWDLLLWALVVEAGVAVAQLFAEFGGFGDFLMSVIAAVVGAFFLFQVREHFMKSMPKKSK